MNVDISTKNAIHSQGGDKIKMLLCKGINE
jgi:hypothetical protein